MQQKFDTKTILTQNKLTENREIGMPSEKEKKLPFNLNFLRIVKGDWKLIWGTEYYNHKLNVPNEYLGSKWSCGRRNM